MKPVTVSMLPSQATSVVAALREQAHQYRQKACERRRIGEEAQFHGAKERATSFFESAYAYDAEARSLDAVSDAIREFLP